VLAEIQATREEREGEIMVKCMICGKVFNGYGAGKHKDETGHNLWELIIEEEK